MARGTGAWGAGGWGFGSWGGDGVSSFTFQLLSVVAFRENIFRFQFSQPVYFSTILDPQDGSILSKWSVAIVPGTVGQDGNPIRPLDVIEVLRPGTDSFVDRSDFGRFIDVVVDRPMTPHPALYDVTLTDIWSADLLSNLATVTERVQAVFKQLALPSLDAAHPSRDFANPMTRDAMFDTIPNPNDALNLGTINVDDTGDYAFDEGLVNLKKRVIRRLITRKGAFAHLPNYGVGVPDYGKKLAVPSVIADLAAQAEAQIALEPDVAKVRVRPVIDRATPGLVRFQVFVRARSGPPQRFDVPFLAGASSG